MLSTKDGKDTHMQNERNTELVHYIVEAVSQTNGKMSFRCDCGYRFYAWDEDDFEVRMDAHEKEEA